MKTFFLYRSGRNGTFPSVMVAALLCCTGVFQANAALRSWTNTLGGSWFSPGNWSPNGVPDVSDIAVITNSGTYSVLVQTGAVSTTMIRLGGGSGTQTLVYGTVSGQFFITNSTVHANGLLLVTNGGLQGNLLVEPGGELRFDTPLGLLLYNFALTNQGTITWTNGTLSVGGNNSDTSVLDNSGLLLMTGDNSISYGGGSRPFLLNSGTVRKLFGTGTSFLGLDVINLPSGLVDVVSGTIQLSAYQTNFLGGSFTATAPGQMKFYGTQTDAGGVASGTGSFLCNGTFYLRTNPIPQLKLAGGDVYIASTFQQDGAITNLTLDGAQLRGTNRVAGTLAVNSGNLIDNLTILPGGQLLLAAPSTLLYSLLLVNNGTVQWTGGPLNVGGTFISNSGTWTILGDSDMSYGGGTTPYFTNYGIVQKTGGTGVSGLTGVTFINQPSGIVNAASGTLQLPLNYTNTGGTLQLNGGTITAFGTLGMTGGQIDGSGTIAAAAVFDGGTVSPGQGPGLLQFKSGLTLGANATVVIDGTGTVPGSQYDQISVAGPLVLSSCNLQVTALPTVPGGTSFSILTDSSAGAISGSFNGLPENSQISVGAQTFRIHYPGATGSAVVLTRDSGSGPQLSGNGFGSNGLQLLGSGIGSTVYTIQATTNFLQWITIGTATANAGGNFNFTDADASKFPYRFYRTSN